MNMTNCMNYILRILYILVKYKNKKIINVAIYFRISTLPLPSSDVTSGSACERIEPAPSEKHCESTVLCERISKLQLDKNRTLNNNPDWIEADIHHTRALVHDVHEPGPSGLNTRRTRSVSETIIDKDMNDEMNDDN